MSISDNRKLEICDAAKNWFREVIASNHIKNTKKLKNPQELDINPFTIAYLANFMSGEITPYTIARAIIYPRVLGTSIATSFGQNLQNFIPHLKDALGNEAKGSITSGMDIEYRDQIDNRLKYCQLKAGPNTINKDDVITLHTHFKAARNLAKTNGLTLSSDCMVVGVLHGERKKLNNHYKKLESEYGYVVLIGEEFWYHLTGDNNFYFELGQAIAEIALEFNSTQLLEDTIKTLAQTDIVKKMSPI
jgi:hypothetical protein